MTSLHMNADKLIDEAQKKGVLESRLIGVDGIIIEDRVNLSCKYGCDDYGRKLTCPPFTPSADEFRKCLKDYEKALLLTFNCPAQIRKHEACHLMSLTHSGKNEIVNNFWSEWYSWKRKTFETMLELERMAFALGYPFALFLGFGSCSACKECVPTFAECRFPSKRRCSMESVGINVIATCRSAGINIEFPVKVNPKVACLILLN